MSTSSGLPDLFIPTAWLPPGDAGTMKDLEKVPNMSALTPLTTTMLSYVISRLVSLDPNPIPLTLTVIPGGPVVVVRISEEPSINTSDWMLALEVTNPPADTV